MRTAYLVEVDTNNGTMFVSSKGALSGYPKFWRDRSSLVRALERCFRNGLDQRKMEVVRVQNLEAGLRQSTATRLSVEAFYASRPTSFAKRPKYPKNAVFKIRLKTQWGDERTKFAGPGRLGKFWAKAGDLRNHITQNIELLKTQYAGADVLIIEFNVDGLTPARVRTQPIIEFYCDSPDSNRVYKNAYSESLGDMNFIIKGDFV